MNTFPFPPGMDWGKLGFTLYSNSLSYREVLNQNPQWTVTELPPIGAVLEVTGTQQTARLQGTPLAFGLPSESELTAIYPFTSVNDYESSLSKYSALFVKVMSNLKPSTDTLTVAGSI